MQQLTILVDMDDVLDDLLPAWVTYLNKEHGTKVSPSNIRSFDMTKAFPNLNKPLIFAPLDLPDFWDTVPPKEGAAEVLEEWIRDGHRVLVVTASHYASINAKMTRVLFRYFPFLQWHNVIVTADKTLIRGDILIDDGIHNLAGGDYVKILMDAPHNRFYPAAEHGMHRVHSWDEIRALVRLISNTMAWRERPDVFAEERLGIKLTQFQRCALRMLSAYNPQNTNEGERVYDSRTMARAR